MFEAFRAQRLGKKEPAADQEKPAEEKPAVTEPEVKKPEPAKPAEVKRVEKESPEAAAAEGYLRRRSPIWLQAVMDSDNVHFLPLGRAPQVIFGLSYNALIVVIMVFVLFTVLVGFIGYTVGTGEVQVAGKPGEKASVGAKPVEGGGAPVQGGTPVQGGRTVTPRIYYRVKVLEVPNTVARRAAVDRDVDFLRRQRVPDVIKKVNPRTRMIALFAGAFTKGQQDQAERLKARLRLMTVDGRREFKDARVVPVQ